MLVRMYPYPYSEIKAAAELMIKKKLSLRETSQECGISKSCLDTRFLKDVRVNDPEIFGKLRELLDYNKDTCQDKGARISIENRKNNLECNKDKKSNKRKNN